MAELDLGRIRFFDKGEHSMETEYVLWDFVTGDGSTYLYTNKTGSTGKALTNGAYWKKLASGLTEAEINAVLIATQEANTATTQANDARDRAIATTDETVIAKNATIQATEDANIATGLANDAVTEINETVIPNAETATQDAISAKDDYYDVVKPAIQVQGEYATTQGDYAKAQGEAVEGVVSLVNNNTLTIEEVTALAIVAMQNRIVALEKVLSEGILDKIKIMNLDIIDNFNIWGKSNLILTGNSAPSVIPDFTGQTFIDTTNKVAYTATGNNSVLDWK